MLAVKRYLRFLQAYSQRQRRRSAARWMSHFCHNHWRIVELGCSNGLLPPGTGTAHYLGIDVSGSALQRARMKFPESQFLEADPRRTEIPAADLVIFLGIVERMSLVEFSRLLDRISAKRVLFSFLDAPTEGLSFSSRFLWRGFRLHRNRFHHTDLIVELLEQHGFKKRELRRCHWLSPGKIILAERAAKFREERPRLAQSAPTAG